MCVADVDSLVTFSITADKASVRLAAGWLADTCSKLNMPPDKIMNLDLCLDEVLMNILLHSGLSSTLIPVSLTFELRDYVKTQEAIVTVSDAGTPFNPLQATSRHQPVSLADAEPGGLGLMIIRSNSDHLSYQFENGQNNLKFGVSWAVA